VLGPQPGQRAGAGAAVDLAEQVLLNRAMSTKPVSHASVRTQRAVSTLNDQRVRLRLVSSILSALVGSGSPSCCARPPRRPRARSARTTPQESADSATRIAYRASDRTPRPIGHAPPGRTSSIASVNDNRTYVTVPAPPPRLVPRDRDRRLTGGKSAGRVSTYSLAEVETTRSPDNQKPTCPRQSRHAHHPPAELDLLETRPPDSGQPEQHRHVVIQARGPLSSAAAFAQQDFKRSPATHLRRAEQVQKLDVARSN
jgi:hypothetical protein